MKISGIYIIKNKLNNKVYVGKSIDIKQRLISHKCNLLKSERNKDENRHLYNSVKKYGWNNFETQIVEIINNPTEELLANREFYWMEYYKSDNRTYGYNLRKDSSTKCFVHEETRELIRQNNIGSNNPNYNNSRTTEMKESMSKIKKQQHKENKIYNEEWKKKVGKSISIMWRDNNRKQRMIKKVREINQKYRFFQYDKNNNLIKIYDSMFQITEENPNFKRSCIYSVCGGYKSSYKGYIWKKELKI